MLAIDFIKEHIKKKSQVKATVIALIPDKHSWFHVHRDEELPTQYPAVIAIK